jgi:shikimate kinase
VTGDHPPARDGQAATPAHVVLVGMMGAGKTTTGLALGRRLGWPVRDCDLDLEERTGRTGHEVAAAAGVEELHRHEEEVLLEALSSAEPSVVSAAGSVVESDRGRRLLAGRATVVWLDVPVDELVTRMASDTHRRPLDRAAAEALLERRRALLSGVADLRLDARTPTPELVAEIVAFLETSPGPADRGSRPG